MATFVRRQLKLDDTLDVFACHGIGGTIGALLTGVFTSKLVNPAGADGVIYGNWATFKANLIGCGAVILYSVVMSLVIYKILSLFMQMRVTDEQEEAGLDNSLHGEYINSEIIAYIEEMNEEEKKQHAA